MDDPLELERIKSAIESLIFISNKPLFIEELKELFENLEAPQIRELIETLKKEHEERNSGVRIVEIAGGFQMVTVPENAATIKNFYKIKHTEKLSGPSLETLAIIAYKQPVTRIDIEAIRGVNVDGVVKSLLEKNLIRIVGRKEVIGRPFVYGTTRLFLDYFNGLRSNRTRKIGNRSGRRWTSSMTTIPFSEPRTVLGSDKRTMLSGSSRSK